MSTLEMHAPGTNRIERFIEAAKIGDSRLWKVTLVFLALTLVMIALQMVDAREINGVCVWVKPAKFFFSLAVQFITVSWAITLLPNPSRLTRGASLAMICAGVFEMIYIVTQAYRGVASHFNTSTPLEGTLYTLMGIGAVTLTATSFIIGVQLWKQRRAGVWTEAAAVGLMLGAVLGTVAGAYLSAQTGHSVGGLASDATGVGIFGWSTTGGDLRIAHFVGLHATQIIPLVALSGKRVAIHATAIVITLATVAVFAQALMGHPLLAT
jgi:hypothetical protein